jgi:acyl-CoA synthetase (AMP-forming)/AMP-acid ligase II
MGHPAAPTVIGMIEAVALRSPDHPALIRDGVPVTYREIVRLVRAMADQLSRGGLGPGDPVGITLDDAWTNILVSLALLRLGCRQVALPSYEPAALRAEMAQRLGLVAVVGTAEAALPGARLLIPDPGAAAAAAPRDGETAAPPARGAEIVFSTSGTTGRPKLMVATEAAILDQADVLAAYGMVFHHQLGCDSTHGRRLTLRSLCIGGTEMLDGAGMPPEALARLVVRWGVERIHLTPRAAAGLVEAFDGRAESAWPEGVHLYVTGARIPQAFRLRLQAALRCRVVVGYGMTEVGLVSIAGPADHGLDPDAVGPVLPGVEVRVVDEAGRALPPDEEGLLRFRSAGMVTGYLDDPEATARGFPDGWFQPGDVGRLTASGQLRVAGRRDDRMTLGVIKIMPAEIEAVAERFPGVRDCAAFALPSRGLGDIPMLAAVAEPGVDAAALLAHCRAALGMRAPRKVVLVPALPRNAAGKVLRRDLVAMARG